MYFNNEEWGCEKGNYLFTHTHSVGYPGLASERMPFPL